MFPCYYFIHLSKVANLFVFSGLDFHAYADVSCIYQFLNTVSGEAGCDCMASDDPVLQFMVYSDPLWTILLC